MMVPLFCLYRDPDIETFAGTTHVTFAVPLQVTLKLIHRVESFAEDQTGRKTQSHGSVIGPLPRREAKWAAPNNIVNRRERTRHLKFEGGSERVSDSKSEVTSPITLDGLHWERFYLILFSGVTESRRARRNDDVGHVPATL
jgi:hypothetical protein